MKFHLSGRVPKLQYKLLPLLCRMFHLLYVIVQHCWQVRLGEFTLLEDLKEASLSYCSVSHDNQFLHLKFWHFSAKTHGTLWEELKVHIWAQIHFRQSKKCKTQGLECSTARYLFVFDKVSLCIENLLC